MQHLRAATHGVRDDTHGFLVVRIVYWQCAYVSTNAERRAEQRASGESATADCGRGGAVLAPVRLSPQVARWTSEIANV
jgi:hypothetical protein